MLCNRRDLLERAHRHHELIFTTSEQDHVSGDGRQRLVSNPNERDANPLEESCLGRVGLGLLRVPIASVYFETQTERRYVKVALTTAYFLSPFHNWEKRAKLSEQAQFEARALGYTFRAPAAVPAAIVDRRFPSVAQFADPVRPRIAVWQQGARVERVTFKIPL
jgi:hypothetical protein